MDLKLAEESANLAMEIRECLKPSCLGQGRGYAIPSDLIERIVEIVARTLPGISLGEWQLTEAGLRVWANQELCLKIAQTGVGNLLEERTKGEVLTQEFRRRLAPGLFSPPKALEEVCGGLMEGAYCDPALVCTLLTSIPLPTLYWSAEQSRSFNGEVSDIRERRRNPMVRAIVFLDQEPVASPQFLNVGELYRLSFRLQGLDWPENAPRLRINLNTTCPSEAYTVSHFVMDKPPEAADGLFEGEVTGNISFKSKLSSLIDDLVFTVHCAFETPEGHLEETPVIGYNELRIKVIDNPRWLPTSERTPLDQRIVELTEALVGDHPSVQQELPHLFPVLQALGRICAVYAQEAAFKARTNVSEKEFQEKVLHDLRMRLDPSEVQEHSQQAGGITDIKYRGVIVELKVEQENGERSHLAQKYGRQVTQYAGVEGKQVSVLLILDLTEKVTPPGDIKNDILVADVPTHGSESGPQEFPSKVFVFVVNGNTRNPSSYSR